MFGDDNNTGELGLDGTGDVGGDTVDGGVGDTLGVDGGGIVDGISGVSGELREENGCGEGGLGMGSIEEEAVEEGRGVDQNTNGNDNEGGYIADTQEQEQGLSQGQALGSSPSSSSLRPASPHDSNRALLVEATTTSPLRSGSGLGTSTGGGSSSNLVLPAIVAPGQGQGLGPGQGQGKSPRRDSVPHDHHASSMAPGQGPGQRQKQGKGQGQGQGLGPGLGQGLASSTSSSSLGAYERYRMTFNTP